jgi:ATP synthase protein I
MNSTSDKSKIERLNENIKNLKNLKKPKNKITNKYSSYGFRVATDLVAGIIVGSFIGYWIDVYFDTKPFFLICCLIFGVFGGFYNIFKMFKD